MFVSATANKIIADTSNSLKFRQFSDDEVLMLMHLNHHYGISLEQVSAARLEYANAHSDTEEETMRKKYERIQLPSCTTFMRGDNRLPVQKTVNEFNMFWAWATRLRFCLARHDHNGYFKADSTRKAWFGWYGCAVNKFLATEEFRKQKGIPYNGGLFE